MKSVSEAPISQGTRVFVRCDLDVDIKNGTISDTYRLESALPTLKLIIEKGGIPIIAGHMGKKLSTSLLAPFFDTNLGKQKYELLENLRFDPGEEENSDVYAQGLANKTQVYVNESFATSHREHASIVGIPKHIQAYAGLNLIKEIETLTKLLDNPQHPFTVIIGGAKLESKMPVVSKFLETADNVLLGGRLGLEWKTEVPEKLKIPSDYAAENRDIGQNTIEEFIKIIQGSKTVLWAGPMGMYEHKAYSQGTYAIANEISYLTKTGDFYSVIGGGDTINAIKKQFPLNDFGFVSTGGGAMLQFLANGTLPGIVALN